MNLEAVIYKYRLEFGPNTILVPADAKLLHFGIQGSSVFVWFEIESAEGLDERVFEIKGTGIPFDRAGLAYRKTLVFPWGVHPNSWHIYERINGTP